MNNAIVTQNLCKQYPNFALQDISFSLEKGSILGVIGENGAGKTTLLKLLLGLIRPSSGSVQLASEKQRIGVCFENAFFYEKLTVQQVQNCLARLQPQFDSAYFTTLQKQFALPLNTPLKQLSRGNNAKLRIAAALAHHPTLLLLDEPTSGLDPVVRAEVLDLLLEFIQNEQCSILLSSHITTDLQRIADEILYLQKGQLVFHQNKDALLEQYAIVKLEPQQLAALPPSLVVGKRQSAFSHTALVTNRQKVQQLLPHAPLASPTLDEIMEYYAKESRQ